MKFEDIEIGQEVVWDNGDGSPVDAKVLEKDGDDYYYNVFIEHSSYSYEWAHSDDLSPVKKKQTKNQRIKALEQEVSQLKGEIELLKNPPPKEPTGNELFKMCIDAGMKKVSCYVSNSSYENALERGVVYKLGAISAKDWKYLIPVVPRLATVKDIEDYKSENKGE